MVVVVEVVAEVIVAAAVIAAAVAIVVVVVVARVSKINKVGVMDSDDNSKSKKYLLLNK